MKSQRVVGLTRSIPGIRLDDSGRLLLTGRADDGGTQAWDVDKNVVALHAWSCLGNGLFGPL